MDMPRTFKEALLAEAEARGMPLSTVAERSGVSYEQIKKIKQRHGASTNVDDAKKVANVFGMTLDEFLDDPMASDRAEIVQTYNSLSPEERAMLRKLAGVPEDQGHS